MTTTTKNLNTRILKLAVPAIFNNITVPLLGLCDTAIAGHLGSAAFLAAMAVGAMMLNVIFWLSGFLRMGTTGLTAQANGAKDFEMIVEILRKAFISVGAISVAVLVLQYPLERLLFLIIAPEESVSDLASLYFRIVLWCTPAQLIIMVVSGWFIGMQNTFIPMVIAVGVNIVNVIMSLLLVFAFNCGFAGIAFGTLIANWLGCIAALIFLFKKIKSITPVDHPHNESDNSTFKIQHSKLLRPSNSKFNIQHSKFNKVTWSRFFKVNADLFFRSACIMGVTLAMVSFGSRLGETTLAANSVIMQYFLFFSYFMDGFAFAGEAIVGKAVGAGDRLMLRKGVSALLGWGALMSVIFLLIYIFATNPITALLTDSLDVRQAVSEMRIMVVILPPVTVAAFIFDGIFIGLTRTRALLWTTAVATAVFFIITFLTFTNPSFSFFKIDSSLPNLLLWIAFESYLLLRGVLLALDYFVKWQKKANFVI